MPTARCTLHGADAVSALVPCSAVLGRRLPSFYIAGRRVYDALNVLYALKIISKEKKDPKKEIRWIGLPNNSVQEYSHMEDLRARKLERIRRKTAHLQELILQQIVRPPLLTTTYRLPGPSCVGLAPPRYRLGRWTPCYCIGGRAPCYWIGGREWGGGGLWT